MSNHYQHRTAGHKIYLYFYPLLLPGVSCLKTGGNNLITAAIPADKLDPRHLVRHYRVTSMACPVLSFPIYFLNASLLYLRSTDESVISHLHDNTLQSVHYGGLLTLLLFF